MEAVTRSKRILIVEDNVDSGEMLAQLVTAWGHEGVHVADGASALRRAREQLPDVVLLDIELPDMDGYEVAALLRDLPAEQAILIIALSGYGADDDPRKSPTAVFDDRLMKPVDMNRLVALIGA